MRTEGHDEFCAEKMFQTMVREQLDGAAASYGFQHLFLDLVARDSPQYSEAVDLFRLSLQGMGLTVSPMEVHRRPKYIHWVTSVREAVPGEWTEVRFFTVMPSVPDALLNCLSVALTVGGLVTAPITSGASLLVSCVSMGFTIHHNAKKEDDPVRISIYRAIGGVAAKKTLRASHDNYFRSALSKQELAKALHLSAGVLDARLPALVSNVVVTPESINGQECYRESGVSGSCHSPEERAFLDRVRKACRRKWDLLNRASWVFPSRSELVVEVGQSEGVVSQGLDLLMEKKVVCRKWNGNEEGFWYTL